jgi:hypothetical protein
MEKGSVGLSFVTPYAFNLRGGGGNLFHGWVTRRLPSRWGTGAGRMGSQAGASQQCHTILAGGNSRDQKSVVRELVCIFAISIFFATRLRETHKEIKLLSKMPACLCRAKMPKERESFVATQGERKGELVAEEMYARPPPPMLTNRSEPQSPHL